jgi:hypothetical protein
LVARKKKEKRKIFKFTHTKKIGIRRTGQGREGLARKVKIAGRH